MSIHAGVILLAALAALLAPSSLALSAARDQPACSELAGRFARTVAGAPNRCTRNAGCASYASGISDCGGVLDKKTATELARLAAEYFKRGCGVTRRCAARVIQPTCKAGYCAERP